VIAQLEGSLQDLDGFCVIAGRRLAVDQGWRCGIAAEGLTTHARCPKTMSLSRHHIRDASFFVWVSGSGQKTVILALQFGVAKVWAELTSPDICGLDFFRAASPSGMDTPSQTRQTNTQTATCNSRQ
jgi:hypothetical protein